MAQRNAAVRQWLSNKERFADLFNVVLFGGDLIISPTDLEQMDSEGNILDVDKQNKAREVRRHRDIVMRWNKNTDLAILACENQENIHYAMPVHTMLYDSLSYTEQIQNLWKTTLENEKVSNGFTRSLRHATI